MSGRKGRERGVAGTETAATVAPKTAAELEEEAAAEEARVASGDWDSLPQGKPENFGLSFRRLIGLLAPHKV
ncbi:MAG: hypothetical protein M3116_01830, partial [Actinomycetota bacterium]|nr:hypothetical protein [Actinomycetota bacterium]